MAPWTAAALSSQEILCSKTSLHNTFCAAYSVTSELTLGLGTVADASNPSYSGGRDQSSRPVWGKFMRPISTEKAGYGGINLPSQLLWKASAWRSQSMPAQAKSETLSQKWQEYEVVECPPHKNKVLNSNPSITTKKTKKTKTSQWGVRVYDPSSWIQEGLWLWRTWSYVTSKPRSKDLTLLGCLLLRLSFCAIGNPQPY
jgi:hypothetical protein